MVGGPRIRALLVVISRLMRISLAKHFIPCQAVSGLDAAAHQILRPLAADGSAYVVAAVHMGGEQAE